MQAIQEYRAIIEHEDYRDLCANIDNLKQLRGKSIPGLVGVGKRARLWPFFLESIAEEVEPLSSAESSPRLAHRRCQQKQPLQLKFERITSAGVLPLDAESSLPSRSRRNHIITNARYFAVFGKDGKYSIVSKEPKGSTQILPLSSDFYVNCDNRETTYSLHRQPLCLYEQSTIDRPNVTAVANNNTDQALGCTVQSAQSSPLTNYVNRDSVVTALEATNGHISCVLKQDCKASALCSDPKGITGYVSVDRECVDLQNLHDCDVTEEISLESSAMASLFGPKQQKRVVIVRSAEAQRKHDLADARRREGKDTKKKRKAVHVAVVEDDPNAPVPKSILKNIQPRPDKTQTTIKRRPQDGIDKLYIAENTRMQVTNSAPFTQQQTEIDGQTIYANVSRGMYGRGNGSNAHPRYAGESHHGSLNRNGSHQFRERVGTDEMHYKEPRPLLTQLDGRHHVRQGGGGVPPTQSGAMLGPSPAVSRQSLASTVSLQAPSIQGLTPEEQQLIYNLRQERGINQGGNVPHFQPPVLHDTSSIVSIASDDTLHSEHEPPPRLPNRPILTQLRHPVENPRGTAPHQAPPQEKPTKQPKATKFDSSSGPHHGHKGQHSGEKQVAVNRQHPPQQTQLRHGQRQYMPHQQQAASVGGPPPPVPHRGPRTGQAGQPDRMRVQPHLESPYAVRDIRDQQHARPPPPHSDVAQQQQRKHYQKQPAIRPGPDPSYASIPRENPVIRVQQEPHNQRHAGDHRGHRGTMSNATSQQTTGRQTPPMYNSGQDLLQPPTQAKPRSADTSSLQNRQRIQSNQEDVYSSSKSSDSSGGLGRGNNKQGPHVTMKETCFYWEPDEELQRERGLKVVRQESALASAASKQSKIQGRRAQRLANDGKIVTQHGQERGEARRRPQQQQQQQHQQQQQQHSPQAMRKSLQQLQHSPKLLRPSQQIEQQEQQISKQEDLVQPQLQLQMQPPSYQETVHAIPQQQAERHILQQQQERQHTGLQEEDGTLHEPSTERQRKPPVPKPRTVFKETALGVDSELNDSQRSLALDTPDDVDILQIAAAARVRRQQQEQEQQKQQQAKMQRRLEEDEVALRERLRIHHQLTGHVHHEEENIYPNQTSQSHHHAYFTVSGRMDVDDLPEPSPIPQSSDSESFFHDSDDEKSMLSIIQLDQEPKVRKGRAHGDDDRGSSEAGFRLSEKRLKQAPFTTMEIEMKKPTLLPTEPDVETVVKSAQSSDQTSNRISEEIQEHFPIQTSNQISDTVPKHVSEEISEQVPEQKQNHVSKQMTTQTPEQVEEPIANTQHQYQVTHQHALEQLQEQKSEPTRESLHTSLESGHELTENLPEPVTDYIPVRKMMLSDGDSTPMTDDISDLPAPPPSLLFPPTLSTAYAQTRSDSDLAVQVTDNDFPAVMTETAVQTIPDRDFSSQVDFDLILYETSPKPHPQSISIQTSPSVESTKTSDVAVGSPPERPASFNTQTEISNPVSVEIQHEPASQYDIHHRDDIAPPIDSTRDLPHVSGQYSGITSKFINMEMARPRVHFDAEPAGPDHLYREYIQSPPNSDGTYPGFHHNMSEQTHHTSESAAYSDEDEPSKPKDVEPQQSISPQIMLMQAMPQPPDNKCYDDDDELPVYPTLETIPEESETGYSREHSTVTGTLSYTSDGDDYQRGLTEEHEDDSEEGRNDSDDDDDDVETENTTESIKEVKIVGEISIQPQRGNAQYVFVQDEGSSFEDESGDIPVETTFSSVNGQSPAVQVLEAPYIGTPVHEAKLKDMPFASQQPAVFDPRTYQDSSIPMPSSIQATHGWPGGDGFSEDAELANKNTIGDTMLINDGDRSLTQDKARYSKSSDNYKENGRKDETRDAIPSDSPVKIVQLEEEPRTWGRKWTEADTEQQSSDNTGKTDSDDTIVEDKTLRSDDVPLYFEREYLLELPQTGKEATSREKSVDEAAASINFSWQARNAYQPLQTEIIDASRHFGNTGNTQNGQYSFHRRSLATEAKIDNANHDKSVDVQRKVQSEGDTISSSAENPPVLGKTVGRSFMIGLWGRSEEPSNISHHDNEGTTTPPEEQIHVEHEIESGFESEITAKPVNDPLSPADEPVRVVECGEASSEKSSQPEVSGSENGPQFGLNYERSTIYEQSRPEPPVEIREQKYTFDNEPPFDWSTRQYRQLPIQTQFVDTTETPAENVSPQRSTVSAYQSLEDRPIIDTSVISHSSPVSRNPTNREESNKVTSPVVMEEDQCEDSDSKGDTTSTDPESDSEDDRNDNEKEMDIGEDSDDDEGSDEVVSPLERKSSFIKRAEIVQSDDELLDAYEAYGEENEAQPDSLRSPTPPKEFGAHDFLNSYQDFLTKRQQSPTKVKPPVSLHELPAEEVTGKGNELETSPISSHNVSLQYTLRAPLPCETNSESPVISSTENKTSVLTDASTHAPLLRDATSQLRDTGLCPTDNRELTNKLNQNSEDEALQSKGSDKEQPVNISVRGRRWSAGDGDEIFIDDSLADWKTVNVAVITDSERIDELVTEETVRGKENAAISKQPTEIFSQAENKHESVCSPDEERVVMREHRSAPIPKPRLSLSAADNLDVIADILAGGSGSEFRKQSSAQGDSGDDNVSGTNKGHKPVIGDEELNNAEHRHSALGHESDTDSITTELTVPFDTGAKKDRRSRTPGPWLDEGDDDLNSQTDWRTSSGGVIAQQLARMRETLKRMELPKWYRKSSHFKQIMSGDVRSLPAYRNYKPRQIMSGPPTPTGQRPLAVPLSLSSSTRMSFVREARLRTGFSPSPSLSSPTPAYSAWSFSELPIDTTEPTPGFTPITAAFSEPLRRDLSYSVGDEIHKDVRSSENALPVFAQQPQHISSEAVVDSRPEEYTEETRAEERERSRSVGEDDMYQYTVKRNERVSGSAMFYVSSLDTQQHDTQPAAPPDESWGTSHHTQAKLNSPASSPVDNYGVNSHNDYSGYHGDDESTTYNYYNMNNNNTNGTSYEPSYPISWTPKSSSDEIQERNDFGHHNNAQSTLTTINRFGHSQPNSSLPTAHPHITVTDTTEDSGPHRSRHDIGAFSPYWDQPASSSFQNLHDARYLGGVQPPSVTMEEIVDSLLGLNTSRSPSSSFTEYSSYMDASSMSMSSTPDQSVSESDSSLETVISQDEVQAREKKLTSQTTTVEGRRVLKSIIIDDGQDGERRNITRSREGLSDISEEVIMVKCSYKRCSKVRSLHEARKSYKTCHNCYTYYCSRDCRKSHWNRHKKKCLYGRVNSLCKHVIYHSRYNEVLQEGLSRIARQGFARRGRGSVMLSFSNVEEAYRYITKGLDQLSSWPDFLSVQDLDESGEGRYNSLQQTCLNYDPEVKFVLNVSIVACQDTPTRPLPRKPGIVLRKCAKVRLFDLHGPGSEVNTPSDRETLILTAPPGIPSEGGLDKKARQVCFVHIQRELRHRGVSLRHQFPVVYDKLCRWVDEHQHISPVTIYPRDGNTGKTFMCLIIPDTDQDTIEWAENPEILETIDSAVDLDAEMEKLERAVDSVTLLEMTV
ncbi:uncharacterized protein [Diadema antillarum]|uniref:uncharacterized protein n=1 Tax=Diadema antillarum TaxID=105358 RepID=UPI003A8B6621